jgi:hypothetical protein
MGWATFWAIFSQTHLVTLPGFNLTNVELHTAQRVAWCVFETKIFSSV